MTIETYDVIRIYKQENNLIEINTWTKLNPGGRFPDYKIINTILVCESNL